MQRVLGGVALLSLLTLAVSAVEAAVELADNERFQTTDEDGRVVSCGYVNGDWIAGKFSRRNPARFSPYKERIKRFRKRVRKASSNRKSKLKKRMRAIRKRKRTEDPICVANAGSTPVDNTPVTPTPTPGSGGGESFGALFDSNGNATAQGLSTLMIPSGLSANVGEGEAFFSANCRQCHNFTLRTSVFPQVRSWTSESRMGFTEASLPDATLADVVAYLNRFRDS